MADDLVNRQHRVRRREDRSLTPISTGLAVQNSTASAAMRSVLEHFRGLGDFPAAGHRDGAERAPSSVHPSGRDRERRRRREDFLLDARTFRARELLPLVLELHRGVDVGDLWSLMTASTTF